MPGKRSWLALGCGAYLAFSIAQFPAMAAYRWFAPDALRLADVSGTLWSGRASLGSVAGLPLRDVEWRLAALPLLIARLSAQISARLADGFVSASAGASIGTLTLTDVRVSTSLDTLAALVPLRGARGLIGIELDRLVVDDGWPTSIVGTFRVQQLEAPPLNAGSSSALVPLGDYQLSDVDVTSDRITARLRDTGGPLEVEGSVSLALQAPATLRGAVPMFDGLVRERDGLPTELREPLEFLTVDVDENGWRTLDLNPWLSSL